MTDTVRGAPATRAERAHEFLDQVLSGPVSTGSELLSFTVGNELQEVADDLRSVNFTAPRSFLSQGLRELANRIRGGQVSAVILLSDGLDQSPDPAVMAGLQAPVFPIELEPEGLNEPETGGGNAWIPSVLHPERTVVNWEIEIQVSVERSGADNEEIPVHLYLGDDRRIRSGTARFAEGQELATVVFSVTPDEPGTVVYRAEIDYERAGDNPDDNHREILVDVTDAANRLLYLEGPAHWGFTFLKRALLSDDRYQLTAFVQSGSGFLRFSETSAQAEAPTITGEALAPYRAVILGNLSGSSLEPEQWQTLADFVDRGGGLLLVGAGAAYGADGLGSVAAMRELLPALPEPLSRMREADFRVEVSPSGRAHAVIKGLKLEETIPPVASLWGPVTVRDGTTVLFEALDGAPLITARRFGSGRVVMFLSDTLWQWHMRAPARPGAKNLYEQTVTQALQWLSDAAAESTTTGEPRLVLNVGALYTPSEGTEQPRTLTGVVQGPDGASHTIELARATLGPEVGLAEPMDGYVGHLAPASGGRYRITVSAPGSNSAQTTILAEPPRHEITGRTADREFLFTLARATGGRFVPWSERERLIEFLPKDTRTIATVHEVTLWDRWTWLLAVLVLFSAEWWWRRRLEMV
jgi:uncharacterized membrane protein